jgi:hypothetical protein
MKWLGKRGRLYNFLIKKLLMKSDKVRIPKKPSGK